MEDCHDFLSLCFAGGRQLFSQNLYGFGINLRNNKTIVHYTHLAAILQTRFHRADLPAIYIMPLWLPQVAQGRYNLAQALKKDAFCSSLFFQFFSPTIKNSVAL
jgi:hypothetical protein